MLTITPATFDTRAFPAVVIDGQPHWLAAQLGDVLGYADAGVELLRSISKHWSDEFLDGRDVIRLDGEDLRPLKDLGLVGARAPSVLLLTESGLYRVLILTGKPVGVRLRDWLTTEVLPSIRRTGSYGHARATGALLEDLATDLKLTGSTRAVVELAVAEAMQGEAFPHLRDVVRAAARNRPSRRSRASEVPVIPVAPAASDQADRWTRTQVRAQGNWLLTQAAELVLQGRLSSADARAWRLAAERCRAGEYVDEATLPQPADEPLREDLSALLAACVEPFVALPPETGDGWALRLVGTSLDRFPYLEDERGRRHRPTVAGRELEAVFSVVPRYEWALPDGRAIHLVRHPSGRRWGVAWGADADAAAFPALAAVCRWAAAHRDRFVSSAAGDSVGSLRVGKRLALSRAALAEALAGEPTLDPETAIEAFDRAGWLHRDGGHRTWPIRVGASRGRFVTLRWQAIVEQGLAGMFALREDA